MSTSSHSCLTQSLNILEANRESTSLFQVGEKVGGTPTLRTPNNLLSKRSIKVFEGTFGIPELSNEAQLRKGSEREEEIEIWRDEEI